MRRRSQLTIPVAEALDASPRPPRIAPVSPAVISVEVHRLTPPLKPQAGLIIPDRLREALLSQQEVRGVLINPSGPFPDPGWVDPSPISVSPAR